MILIDCVCYSREFENIFLVYLIKHISLPESNEKPMMDNIDLHMLKLQSLMTKTLQSINN